MPWGDTPRHLNWHHANAAKPYQDSWLASFQAIRQRLRDCHCLGSTKSSLKYISTRCLNGNTRRDTDIHVGGTSPQTDTGHSPEPKRKASCPNSPVVVHGKVSIWCISSTADWSLPHGQAWAPLGSMHCELQNADMIYAMFGNKETTRLPIS